MKSIILSLAMFAFTATTFAQTNGSFKDLNKIAPHSLLANKYLLKEKNNSSGLQNSYLHILKYTDEGFVEVAW